MTLEAQRLYDTSQGGDELSTATHLIIKAHQAKKAHKHERVANRPDIISRRIAQAAAAASQ